MWERAIARQSTLSKRIDENLFAFWIKLPPAASGFGGRHPRFSSAFTHPRAEILDRCDPRTLDVSREAYSTRTVSSKTVARALASHVHRTHASSPPAFLRETKFSAQRRKSREEKKKKNRKRDDARAMRIICAPLLFVDAVGTLVPTNAEDRNANAIFVLSDV